MIRLFVVGQSSIELDGKRLTTESEIVFGMLLYLTARAGDKVAREEVQMLVWPQLSHKRGRHCLRQALYRLRQLGVPLKTDNDSITIALGDVSADYAALVSHDVAASAYRDLAVADILPAYQPAFSIPFSAWVEELRSRIGLRIRQGLVRTIIDLRSKGRYREAEPLARACLTADPLNEVATLTLAEARAVLSGNRAEAVAILDRYMDDIGGSASKRLTLLASVVRRRISERFIEERYAAPPEPPFVGREDVLQLLVESMQEATTGRSTVVYLWGEPGIGKTRLLAELSKVASVQGVHAEQYTVTPNDPDRSLSLFSFLLPKLVSLPGAIGIAQEHYDVIQRFIDPSGFDTTRYPDSARASAQIFGKLKSAIVELIDALADERPLAMLVDDMHWIDASSLEILADLVERLRNRRVVFVFTSRDTVNMTRRGPTEALRARASVRRLDGLEAKEIETLLGLVAAQRNLSLSAEFVRRTISASAGNPFFVSELATHYGWNGICDDLPHSMQTLLQKRLEALTPESLLVFQACVVLGEYSTISRIGETIGSQLAAVARNFHELEEAGLILTARDAVLCRHQLLAREALKKLSTSVARALHAGAANVLEAELRSHLKLAVAQACLSHCAAAHQTERCERLAVDIGRRLIDVGVPNDALALLDSTLALQPGSENRGEVLAARLFAARASGEWQEVSRTLAELESVATRVDLWEDGEFRRIAYDARKFAGDSIGIGAGPQLALLKRGDLSIAATKKVAVNALIACSDDFDNETALMVYAAHFRDVDFNRAHLDDLVGNLVFHTSFGSLDAAQSVAQLIANRCSHAPISGHRQPQLLRWCARPFHLAGNKEQAESLLASACALAHERGQRGEIHECYIQNLLNELDLEDVTACAKWLERVEALPSRALSEYTHATLLLVRLREAALRNDAETVRRCLGELEFCRLPPLDRVRLTFSACRLRASALSGVVPGAEDIDRLLRLSKYALEATDMDWIVGGLCAVATSGDWEERVRALVSDYVRVRRAQFPLPQLIRDLTPSVPA